MYVSKATDTSNSTSTALTKGSSALGKDEFLKLLITQMQHQDPTNPVQDQEFIAQLAQFSSLEQMQQVNEQMTTMLSATGTSQAVSLIGHTIQYLDADGATQTGKVDGVKFDSGSAVLTIGDTEVNPSLVTLVQ